MARRAGFSYINRGQGVYIARRVEKIKSEIIQRFGFFPPFFQPALSDELVLENLWQQTVSSYVDNPLPEVFKEKLAAVLSRYCTVPYCLISHSSSLRPLGVSAGAIFDLLSLPTLSVPELKLVAESLVRRPPLEGAWQDLDREHEREIFSCCISVFLNQDTQNALAALRRNLGPCYAHLVMFLAYNRTALQWAEANPQIPYREDERVKNHFAAITAEEPRLALFFEEYVSRVKGGALQIQRNWLERALHELPLPIYMADPLTGRYLYGNLAMEAMLGHRFPVGEDRQVQEQVMVILDAATRARVNFENYPSARAARGDYVAGQEYIWCTKNGERHVAITANQLPELYGRNSPSVFSVQDLTQAKAAAFTLEANLERLQQERSIREQFVTTLTHDLRTPLTTVKLSAQLLLRRDEGPARTIIQRIIRGIDRTENMVRDLLDANSIKAGQSLPIFPEPCNLASVASDTLLDLNSIHKNRFQLSFEGNLDGRWDAEGLRRVLENLCGNAVKYGDEKAMVSIALKGEANSVRLSVHNCGYPISELDQQKIFQSFGRSKSALTSGKLGWGIGLTLVKSLVEAHGGQISLVSSSAEGTTFTIELPQVAPEGLA